MRRTAPAIKSASNPQFSFVVSGRCCCTARIFIPIDTTEKQYVSFNDDFTDWQYASGVIIPKQRGLMIKDITVYCAYDYNANYAYFTNISLVLEPAETYSYDSKGNPIAATDGNAKTASEFFADSQRLKSYTTPGGAPAPPAGKWISGHYDAYNRQHTTTDHHRCLLYHAASLCISADGAVDFFSNRQK